MKTSSGKPSKSTAKTPASQDAEQIKSSTNKDDIMSEDEEMDAIDLTPKKGGKTPVKSKASDEDEEDDAVAEEADDWEKTEDDDENWDPDFDEFDIPKSGAKAGGGLKKSAKDDDDDFKVDDEFKDMFGGGSGHDDDEDDDY